jgi:hypothetical protein
MPSQEWKQSKEVGAIVIQNLGGDTQLSRGDYALHWSWYIRGIIKRQVLE